ncbi:thymocyte nuclear protein 1 [Pyrus x bretschneideri]|uniref:thymocyte nuclear protein 1 n=1 Tax=Pyrus x bretschneideri TaxID=225117 RepID=UPI00202E409C|nr:thymocyte nuclear protein 1 [Pyrus x bretschneideri]
MVVESLQMTHVLFHFTTIAWRQSTHLPRQKNPKPIIKTLCIPEQKISNKSDEKTPTPSMAAEKQYWLLKTEPGEWSWEDQAANGGVTKWDGVKNKQAQKYLKSMKLSDLCFFYHSGTKARRVVGVVSVLREWYSEGGDDAVVDVKAVGEMRRPVDLKEMKRDQGLKGFALFRQPRLSVVPVSEDVWMKICDLGSGYEGDGNAFEDDGSGGESGGEGDE